ncbi:SUKH-4 immunity protein [Streptomyces sp. 3213]|uniref:SUKH-4 family immunity protein n=1 Tax=Streptomyces sp. 3213.3 TaxID=1855348 RepID=UPI0008951FB3|nr:SUKH-4 family immunity protein [Streptomyces sp. 3213.3]SEE21352.1 SUKH-4 immunity protein [Streptomyces sp. 3213] [Streptomyces sp. 3213.3]
MSPYHRYTVSYVAHVREKAAREFLSTIGLPAESRLFTAEEALAGQDHDHLVTQEAVLVGLEVGDAAVGPASYYVDCETGSVSYDTADGLASFHVSNSPRAFAACLEVFERGITEALTETKSEPEDWEEVAETLQQAIGAVDPSTLRDDPGFWHSLLFDVANGDYAGAE